MFCHSSSNHSTKRTRFPFIGAPEPCSWDFSEQHTLISFSGICFLLFLSLSTPPFFYFPYLVSDSTQATPTLPPTSPHTLLPPCFSLSHCLSFSLSGEGVWQQQQVRYKITGEAGAIIPPADAGVFMRRVTVNDSVVVSPEARAQLWETCCFCQPSFLLWVFFSPPIWFFVLSLSLSHASTTLRAFTLSCHASALRCLCCGFAFWANRSTKQVQISSNVLQLVRAD